MMLEHLIAVFVSAAVAVAAGAVNFGVAGVLRTALERTASNAAATQNDTRLDLVISFALFG